MQDVASPVLQFSSPGHSQPSSTPSLLKSTPQENRLPKPGTERKRSDQKPKKGSQLVLTVLSLCALSGGSSQVDDRRR